MQQFNLSSPVKHTLEIKKSQFITWLLPVNDKEQAKDYLSQAKLEYPDARHHCWAYKIGNSANSLTAAMSDDGEPSGTAGKPMLNVLQHKPVSNVMAIVIRYFGGIKLGAGGLVRAYSQAVEQAFAEAELIEIIPTVIKTCSVPFAQEQFVRHQAGQHQSEIVKVNYSNTVELRLEIPETQLNELEQVLINQQITLKSSD